MHAVRGTIGYDPNTPDPAAKRASRDRHFGIERLGDEQLDVPSPDEQAVTFLSGAEVDAVDAAVEADPETLAVVHDVVVGGEVVETIELPGRFLVEWKNSKGQPRYCGKVSGGLSPEGVIRLWGVLTRSGVTVITVTRRDAS